MMQRYALYCFFFFYSYIAVAHPVYRSIEFIENKGQWDGPFLYKGMTGKSDVYLEPDGFTYVIGAGENPALMHDVKFGRIPKANLRFYAYRVKFDGANTNIPVTGSKPQEHYNNYFLGNNPDKWKTGIHPNLAVDYKNVYANIDLHVASEESEMKYDFIVYPGGNPEQIALKYEGVTKLRTKNKNLLVGTSLGDVEELAPYCYQYVDGEKKEIRCEYRVDDGKVRYHFPEGYNKNEILVIDPTVRFATFTGSTADNFGYTATYDAQTNFYAGGTANATGYPGVTGFFQTTYAGGGNADGNTYFTDMAITKFNAAGSARIYSTYIGGSENDQPHSMIVDASGNLVIVGRSYSNNFPRTATAYDTSYNGNADIVVVKLNAAGTALIGSTYVGGSGDEGVNISSLFGTINTSLKHSYADDARSEVILDNAGNVYVAASTNSSNFPMANAMQGTKSPGQDGVVFKLTSNLNGLTWSTYIGGNGDDACYVLALNPSQSHIYVSGGTASSNFPISISPGLWGTYQGAIDGFIVKFENSVSYSLVRGTFIGTGAYDQCFGVQVDASNNVYAVGNTLGTFPRNNVVFGRNGASQFIIKLDSNLATNIYSTAFGSVPNGAINITPVAFLVDTCQNVYISGWGGTLTGGGGSTAGMDVNLAGTTPGNIMSSTTDGNDFYFIVLEKNLQTTTPLFGGYYGASTIGEHVDGGTSRFDRNGIIYQAICGGCGGSSAPPTTPGVVSQTNASPNCNLIAIKVEFNFGAVNANAQASPNKVLCIGETVNFVNTSSNAVSYDWNFGDGGTSTLFQPSHAFTQVGTFTVRMIAINPNACRERDTITLTITVDTNTIDAQFTASIIDSCDPYSISILNSSKYGKNPGAASFLWDFGDGNTTTGATPGTHIYAAPGTYTVKLVMTDLTACNSPDSMTQTITFVENVDASFQVANVCFGDTLFLANTSTNASNYLWKIGDSDTSTGVAPYYLPDSAGTFTIKLYAYNSATCNKVDSVEKTVTINPKPIADFIYTPSELDIKANDSLIFTNKSILADSYNWNFGDGTGSQDFHTSHFYKKTGYYNVCLYSSNKGGCTDTICKKVYADILPLADIPTAFSPNGDGNNDILYIRGSAIQTVDLKIFNRWGEMVFHTTDVAIGWDGKYKGKPHEMDAFAYVLNVVFIDETTFYKKGNVTLLR